MANIVWQVRWWTTYFSLWDSRHTPPQQIYRCHSPAAWRSCRSSCPWPGSRQWPSPPTSCTCHTDCVRGRSGSVEEQEEHHSQKDQLLKVYVKPKIQHHSQRDQLFIEQTQIQSFHWSLNIKITKLFHGFVKHSTGFINTRWPLIFKVWFWVDPQDIKMFYHFTTYFLGEGLDK